MNTVSVHTTQNIELEFDLASLGERLVAWLIDALIFLAILLLLVFFSQFQFTRSVYHRNPWLSIFILIPFGLFITWFAISG
jgi:uncharacterized RDD family membrane protein YckC